MQSTATIHEPLYWRTLAEMGRAPYFAGAGTGLLQALHRAFGPWPIVVGSGEAASPVMAWLRQNTRSEIFHFPPPVGKDHLIPVPIPQGAWDRNLVPTVLGGSEREVLHVHSVAFGLGSRPENYRYRRLDDILGATPALGLLFCGHLEGAAGVLQGARGLLRQVRPLVLLARNPGNESGSVENELATVCRELAEAGYKLYDSTVSPCETGQQQSDALRLYRENVFLGLPVEYCTPDLPQRLVGDVDDPILSDDPETIRQVAFWQFLSGYSGPSVPGRIEVLAQESKDWGGFYELENWESTYWRWSGPLPQASVRIPIHRPGRYRMRCQLFSVERDEVLSTMRIFAGKHALRHTTRRTDYSIILESVVSVFLRGFSPVLEIKFLHSETYHPDSGDPRKLGFALQSITLELME